MQDAPGAGGPSGGGRLFEEPFFIAIEGAAGRGGRAAFAESETSAATCAPGGVAADARDTTCRIGADPSGEK
jgi:hypothetical protein